MNPIDPLDVINNSKCKNCKHLMKRTIELITQDDRNYFMPDLDLDDDDEYDLYIEQYKCLVTSEDIEGVVVSCNYFVPSCNINLIREYKF